jgi:hypothetical protein
MLCLRSAASLSSEFSLKVRRPPLMCSSTCWSSKGHRSHQMNFKARITLSCRVVHSSTRL